MAFTKNKEFMVQKEACSHLKLSKLQKQVLIGVILGDAHLETQTKRKTYHVKFCQSDLHKDYLFHLYELFSSCSGTVPHETTKKTWAFSTRSSVSFRFYGQYFFNDKGKKVIPRNIGKFLTPIVLAYWFMDDGSITSKQSKGVIFNTHAYVREEVEFLISVLQQKFNLIATLRKQKDGYQIYISGYSYENFVSLVEVHLHESMKYKLPPPRKIKKCE